MKTKDHQDERLIFKDRDIAAEVLEKYFSQVLRICEDFDEMV